MFTSELVAWLYFLARAQQVKFIWKQALLFQRYVSMHIMRGKFSEYIFLWLWKEMWVSNPGTNISMADIKRQVGWISVSVSVSDNASTLLISYHRDTVTLHLPLKERQKSFIPTFSHYKAMEAIPWHGVHPRQQISFRQNRHSFGKWRIKETLLSNRKVFFTFSGVSVPTESQGQGHKKISTL